MMMTTHFHSLFQQRDGCEKQGQNKDGVLFWDFHERFLKFVEGKNPEYFCIMNREEVADERDPKKKEWKIGGGVYMGCAWRGEI